MKAGVDNVHHMLYSRIATCDAGVVIDSDNPLQNLSLVSLVHQLMSSTDELQVVVSDELRRDLGTKQPTRSSGRHRPGLHLATRELHDHSAENTQHQMLPAQIQGQINN